MIALDPIMKRQISLKLERRFVNSLQAWDGTAVRLDPPESASMVQRLTQFGLRMVNMRNGLMKN